MIADELNILANKLVSEYRAGLARKGKNASYRLANSLEVQQSTFVSANGLGYKAEILGNNYWYQVNHGRGPTRGSGSGTSLREAILEWIRIKPVTPYPMANGKTPTEQQLAFLISRKIHREGYKGSDTFSEVTDAFMNNAANFEALNESLVRYVFDNKKINI